MNKGWLIFAFPLCLTACTTLNESLELGAGLGAATGAAATYTAISAQGKNPEFEDVALGTGIGVTVGLLTSYITHSEVQKDRAVCGEQEIDMQFGDLPPSPFVFPKRGGAR